MVREAAVKTGELVGDGTTTSTVLAESIIREGVKAIAAGMNPMDLKRGIDLAVEAAVADMKAHSRPVAGREEIIRVGTISANGDRAIGEMVADAMDRVGKEGAVTIEEAKADVTGLFALQYLVDHGKLDKQLQQTMYTTYLASMFRSIRFGLTEAHGRGVAIQLNYFLDHGGVTVASDGTFAVNPARIRQNVVDLTRDIMTLQALGDYPAATQLISTLGVVRPQVQTVLDRLKDVPVDIEPRFVTAQQLLAQEKP